MIIIPKSGWIPQPIDNRDYTFAAKAPTIVSGAAGSGVYLGGSTSSVAVQGVLEPENQGYTGSCVGWSVGTMYAFVHKCSRRSALQIYYESRRAMGEEFLVEDSGCWIRDAVKYVCNFGAGRDDWWPNVETRFDIDPPVKVDRDGLRRNKGSYYALNGAADYRLCLEQGFPFVIGIQLYANFNGSVPTKHGIVGMPYGRGQGGHAVTVIGYDDNFHDSEWVKKAMAAGVASTAIPTRVYFVRNSWGKRWGNNGDFAIDANYIDNSNYAVDGWTIRPPVKAPATPAPAPLDVASLDNMSIPAPKAKGKK